MPTETGDMPRRQRRRADPDQLVLWKKRGGKRRGAGRPPKGARAGSPTGIVFPGWAEYGDAPFLWRGPATYDPLWVYQPRTWLLREGWKKAGAISCREVPSARQ